MSTGQSTGPFYLRVPGETTREGLWYEEEPPEVDPSLTAEFRFRPPKGEPRAREGYYRVDEASPTGEGPTSWTPVRPLTDEVDPEPGGHYLVDPREVDPVRLFALSAGSWRIFLDVRACSWPLSTLHALPVQGWIQGSHRRPPTYRPEVEPEGRPGSDPILWLQHGFTGDPKSWEHTHRRLSRAPWGYISPLLPGHGLEPEEFEQYEHDDWTRFVETLGEWLGTFGHDTLGIGLSMGGALLLRHWEFFRGLVLINVPYHVPDWRRHLLPLISLFRRFYTPADSGEKVPVQSLLALRRLLHENRRIYPRVKRPVLVVNHRDDTTVPSDHGKKIVERLPDAEWVRFDRGGHESPEDPEMVPKLLRVVGDWAEKRNLGLENFAAQTGIGE